MEHPRKLDRATLSTGALQQPVLSHSGCPCCRQSSFAQCHLHLSHHSLHCCPVWCCPFRHMAQQVQAQPQEGGSPPLVPHSQPGQPCVPGGACQPACLPEWGVYGRVRGGEGEEGEAACRNHWGMRCFGHWLGSVVQAAQVVWATTRVLPFTASYPAMQNHGMSSTHSEPLDGMLSCQNRLTLLMPLAHL